MVLRGINSTMKTLKQVEAIDAICESTYKDLEITEAEYQGKKVKLNDPIRGGSKKFYVYVKNPKGNICLLYTSPSPRDRTRSRMPSSA